MKCFSVKKSSIYKTYAQREAYLSDSMTWEQCCEKFGTLPKFRDLMKDLPSVKSAEDMAGVLDDRGATFQVGKAFDHFFQVKRDSVFISETSLLKKNGREGDAEELQEHAKGVLSQLCH